MANQLIIIGNGFDLAHGLKTTYHDFFIWYLNKIVKSVHNKNNYTYQDKLVNIESAGEILRTVPINNARDFENIIQLNAERIEYKASDFFGKVFASSKIHGWVDIENIYYEELIECSSRVYSGMCNKDHAKEVLRELNDCLTEIKNQLAEYLKTLPKPERIFEIEKHFKSITNSANKCCILNFNYTSTVELYSKRTVLEDDIRSIINIHGDINNETKNPIIFGHGDEMDLEYEKMERLNIKEFLVNLKSFWYFKSDNYQNLQKFLQLNYLFEVHIMGHSCGLSDRILLNSIFEHPSCYKIKIYYHQRSSTPNDNDFFDKTIEISRHFRDKARMRNSIKDAVPLIKFPTS